MDFYIWLVDARSMAEMLGWLGCECVRPIERWVVCGDGRRFRKGEVVQIPIPNSEQRIG